MPFAWQKFLACWPKTSSQCPESIVQCHTQIFPSQWEFLLAWTPNNPLHLNQVSQKTSLNQNWPLLVKVCKIRPKSGLLWAFFVKDFFMNMFHDIMQWKFRPCAKILSRYYPVRFVSWGRTFRTAVPFILDYCCYQYYPRVLIFDWFFDYCN